MKRHARRALAGRSAVTVLLVAWVLSAMAFGHEDPTAFILAPGWRADVVATAISRPVQIALDGDGGLVVLSHGSAGDSAAEIVRLDLRDRTPIDARRLPRLAIPFAEGPRQTVFGSLALDARSGDLFLGEENGNRVYRLGRDQRLALLVVGLNHLVGGDGLALDHAGRLLILDYVSPEAHLRSEAPPTGALHWLADEGYQGPLLFRIDPAEPRPLPRRLDLALPLHPRAGVSPAGRAPGSRFIAVAAGASVVLVDSLGEVVRLEDDGRLRTVARLPSGHYHRTSTALAPDGSLFISTGLHIRQLLRVSPGGAVSAIASNLGDPNGVAVDPRGVIYLAETVHHRILRLSPAP